MPKSTSKLVHKPFFYLALLVSIALLASAAMVAGQGSLTPAAYLPVIMTAEIDVPAGPGDWPMVAANAQRTSWSPEEVTGQLQIEWYRPIEAYIPQNSQIIAANGLLYVSTSKGLYALNAASGQIAWRYDTELPLGNSPTVADGIVYVGGYDRKLHALNAITGAHLWAFEGAAAGYDTNPLVLDGKVFVGNRDGKMYAIGAHGTPQQGELIWAYQTGGAIHFSAAYSSGTLYFVSSDNYAYALDVDSGELVWRSERLPGLQYHSYWPVVYEDKVIFPVAFAYRNAMRPGSASITNSEGAPYGDFRAMQLFDVFPEMVEGTTLGPEASPQPWAHGYPVIDASRVTEYLEDNPNPDPHVHKPWRRMLVVLNRSDGSEYTFDSDQDGYGEYIPALYWGTGSGNRYPPIVGADGILYFSNLYRCCSDAKGRIMGWSAETPSLLSVTYNQAAIAEPQAISAGGNIIYRNLCCDRLGDWLSIIEPNYSGQVWSYDLAELAPGYDEHTWAILPGWPRLKGWYTGNSNTINAAYHNHGDQNPIIPYQGRLYVHRSNTIFAFGPGNGPGPLPLLTIDNVQPVDASLTEAELTARLEAEVQEMLDAGHLRPGYYNVAQFMARGLEHYFDNPGDTIYTLARAYPHLSHQLQADVRTYLQQEFDTYFDPEMYARIGWDEGAPREDIILPPEVETDLINHPSQVRSGPGFVWQYPQHNFYTMWKYAELFPDQAAHVYALAKGKIQVPVPPFATDDYLLQQPYEHNAWIAGYIGFLELQELAGMDGVDPDLRTQVNEELDRLLQLRVTLFTKDSYWVEDRFHKKHLDIARNFMFLVPELGDYLDQNIRAEVQEAVDEYEYIAPYWFVSRYESVIGEGVMSNLYNYNALFNAKAYILKESQAELTKYIDVPAFARGDLFYIQNLVAALEAP